MIDADAFSGVSLRGEFKIVSVNISTEPLVDVVGREAIARTQITGRNFEITIRPGLSDEEFSVTLYHEILEAATVAATNPPASVMNFNEGKFEAAPYQAHRHLGAASPDNLNRMLQQYDFPEIINQ
jgi:C-terminal processing protease CtpA/Prc